MKDTTRGAFVEHFGIFRPHPGVKNMILGLFDEKIISIVRDRLHNMFSAILSVVNKIIFLLIGP